MKILFVVGFFVGFPLIFGAIPFMLCISLVIAAVAGYIGIRVKNRTARIVSFGLSAYLSVLPILGFLSHHSRQSWIRDLRESNCGISPGMSRDEARILANSCGRNVKEHGEGFHFQPPGFGRFNLLDLGLYGVNVDYDAKGKVARAYGWSD